MDPEFQAALDAFVAIADRLSATEWERRGYTYAPPETHRGDVISDKWVRVVTIEHRKDGIAKDGSVYAFVALRDFENKTLGAVKAGDIHKAASYVKPAKHARGNIFAADPSEALSTRHWPGVRYLR